MLRMILCRLACVTSRICVTEACVAWWMDEKDTVGQCMGDRNDAVLFMSRVGVGVGCVYWYILV